MEVGNGNFPPVFPRFPSDDAGLELLSIRQRQRANTGQQQFKSAEKQKQTVFVTFRLEVHSSYHLLVVVIVVRCLAPSNKSSEKFPENKTPITATDDRPSVTYLSGKRSRGSLSYR